MNKYLFVFENPAEAIVETKLIGMPDGSPPDKVYFWLRIDKKSGTCTHLKFVSMEKEPVQIRVFEQGILNFNEKVAVFSGQNITKRYLNKGIENISEKTLQAVSTFLKSLT